MFRLFSASVIAAGLALAAHAGESKRVVLDIPGMNCSLCPISVRKAAERVPGVSDARADLASKTAEVTFDPQRATPEAIAKAVSDAGYPATVRTR